MANPYRSKEGLSARPVGTSDEIQLRIDPLHGDLDEEITGLHSQVRRLKAVAQEIETETKLQNDLITDLQMTLSQAGAGLKNGMRRLNRTVQQSSNHIVHVIIFGLILFTLVYFWSKIVRK
ncbi:Target SNARE coiled-coil domain containing protein [Trema orientale]|uniref:Target SNARE coiled-coil domain containing protein n=1 Tax=Trema orientale TaxID=63057 RepID=A0A2P5EGY5_TREOI|nr:Target SNARE coiled-coil domain containing protein [Trema orientale]